MKRISARAKYLVILMVAFIACAAIFASDYITGASSWVSYQTNQNIYHDGELTVAGEIYSSDGVRLLSSSANGMMYADDMNVRLATLHTIGDKNDSISNSILTTKRDKLIGYNVLNGLFDSKSKEHEMQLTINAQLSSLAYQSLGTNHGAVAIMNYKTGEVLTMVSKPSFDPDNPPSDDASDEEGIYLNRVLNGLYVPGSIMKLVTTYAAIENISDIESQTFDCQGGITIGDQWIECNGVHGHQTFEQALANSCNVAFGLIANQLGNDTLANYVDKSGLTTSTNIDGAKTSPSRFNLENASSADLAWAGIGQYTTLVNPMQFLEYVSAIANDGTLEATHYIKDTSFLSSITKMTESDTRLLDETSAKKLQELMRNNTMQNYGDYNFAGLNIAAKTGTAEVENDNPHAWFVGFSANEDTPYAFVFIVENASYTGAAMDAAINVLNQIPNIIK